jgi:hypothetical protein
MRCSQAELPSAKICGISGGLIKTLRRGLLAGLILTAFCLPAASKTFSENEPVPFLLGTATPPIPQLDLPSILDAVAGSMHMRILWLLVGFGLLLCLRSRKRA